MIKNIKEIVNFPVYMLASKPLPNDLIAAIDACNGDSQNDNINTVIALIPDWFAEELKEIGLTAVDTIPLQISVGSILFDLYVQHITPPKAPLANALFVKRRSEIAEILDSDEFEVPKEVFDTSKAVLMEDSLWNKARISAVYQKSESEGIAFEIKASGVSSYKEIMNELINAFLG